MSNKLFTTEFFTMAGVVVILFAIIGYLGGALSDLEAGMMFFVGGLFLTPSLFGSDGDNQEGER